MKKKHYPNTVLLVLLGVAVIVLCVLLVVIAGIALIYNRNYDFSIDIISWVLAVINGVLWIMIIHSYLKARKNQRR